MALYDNARIRPHLTTSLRERRHRCWRLDAVCWRFLSLLGLPLKIHPFVAAAISSLYGICAIKPAHLITLGLRHVRPNVVKYGGALSYVVVNSNRIRWLICEPELSEMDRCDGLMIIIIDWKHQNQFMFQSLRLEWKRLTYGCAVTQFNEKSFVKLNMTALYASRRG